MSIICRLLSIT